MSEVLANRGVAGASAATTGVVPRYRGVLDVALVAACLPAVGTARRVAHGTVPKAVAAMAGHHPWTFGCPPDRVARAAARASRLVARLRGGLDSCLTRSLVVGAALAARGHVELHVGFRPSADERPVDGHAWVVLDGHAVGERDAVESTYERTMAFAFGGGGRE